MSSLQPSSGLPGNPGPSISTLFPRSPQTDPLPPSLLRGSYSAAGNPSRDPGGGRRLSSRPHLHFQNFVTPSPQVQGRALERSPTLCRPRPVPALHSPAATATAAAAAAAAAKVAPRKPGGGKRTCAGGRAGAGRTSRAVPSVSPGGGELQQVPILYTEQRTGPSALSELKIPALHTALFLFLLARRAGTLEQVWTPARLRAGTRKKPSTPGKKVDL